jgi:hypothetical protein
MIIILGLVILVAALIVGVAGVLGNGGSAHAVSHFSVLGYHLTGSAGTLFLAGIVVGAVGLLGLTLLLAGARRTSRRGSDARRGLRQSRRETAAATQERDDLIGQRDAARADAASHLNNGTGPQNASPSPPGDRWSRLRGLGHRLAPAQTGESDAMGDEPAAEVPASASGPGVPIVSQASDVTAGASEEDMADTSPALDAHANEPVPAE